MPQLAYAKPAEIGLDERRLTSAYDRLEEWTSGKEPPIPGGAILVGRQGKIVEPRFFGRQGPEADAPPIRRDGIFLLASITKPVVYVAAMILVERGKLNLSDRVTRYIPEFKAHGKEETLVGHLFTHTSGLPDMLKNNEQLRREHAPLEKFLDGAIKETVPLFKPGTKLSYQSMGTAVVAEIIQRLSGKSIAEFLRKEIFDRLVAEGRVETRSMEEFESSMKILIRLAQRQHERVPVPPGRDPAWVRPPHAMPTDRPSS